jgi:hypothetical protein
VEVEVPSANHEARGAVVRVKSNHWWVTLSYLVSLNWSRPGVPVTKAQSAEFALLMVRVSKQLPVLVTTTDADWI